MGLGRAGGEGRLPRQPVALEVVRRPPEPGLERGEQFLAAFAVTFRRREEMRSIASVETPTIFAGLAVRAHREHRAEGVVSRSSVVRSATAPATGRHR